MASYNELLALIDAYINRNGVQAITGQILNGVLKAMVDQLGRGYTLMGYAEPTGDPGTPDGPESWFASVPGTYTNYGEIQVAAGELTLLSFAPSEGWTKNTIYEGFREVTADIDGNVGTPEVGVSYANGVLSFDFRNMKGNPGDPAGFGTVNATVDDQVGTPSVSVSSSGPDTAKNFAFAFHNLKGETGVTSVVATVDNTSGNPQCSVSLQGGQLTLAFTGLKGAQGNTGSSVDYPFTIVNNLTTDDPTQALSAAMGVELDGKVGQLEAKVDELDNDKVSNDELFDETVGKNLINTQASGVLLGKMVYKGSSGNLVIVDNSQFNTTDFIQAESSTNYVFSVRGVASSDTYGKPRFVTFYDSGKNLLDGLNSTSDNVSQFATPANTAFIRITIYTLSWTTGSQLEKGTQATTYEPYSYSKLIKESLLPDMGVDALTTDVDAMQAELDGKDGQEYDLTGGDFGYVKYADGVFVDRSTAQDYLTIEVAGVVLGEKFQYRLYATDIVTMVAAYDKDGNYLKNESIAGNASIQDGFYVVGNPAISKLKFCCTSSNISTYGYKVISLGKDGISERVTELEQSASKDINPFEGVNLSNLDLNASATRNDDGTITLANGGKAYWGIPTVAVAYSMSAKFIYETGLSFSIGKDQAGDSGYGGRIVLRDGYIDYYRNSLDDGTYTHTTEETGITLNDGEEYSIYLHRTFNYENAERKISVEIFGQYNEHFEIVLNSGPWYGRPFISAAGAGCDVLDFNFSLHLDYDLRNSVLGVWGHSYVEADSLYLTDKLDSFTNLLGDVFGHDRLFNFGWGGDYAQRLLTRIQGESRFTRAIGYALIVIGANDTSYQLSQVEEYMEEMGVYLLGIGITPIFATHPPIPAKNEAGNQFLADLSTWVKESGYKYVDMRQVFLDANGNVRTSLYLADNTHPTVEGHQLIFNRIKMDCPYLF